MEIQALKLTVTEKDLNELVRRHLPAEQPVEELEIRVAAEGLCLTGVLTLFIDVKFETLWTVSVQQRQVLARLARFKAWGMAGSVFKSAIVKLLADAARDADWLHRDGDSLLVDVDRFLRQNGLPLKTNLSAVLCQEGHLLIEATVGR